MPLAVHDGLTPLETQQKLHCPQFALSVCRFGPPVLHAPHWQFVPQVRVPLQLQVSVSFGEQGPDPTQPPQTPPLQLCVPQLPQGFVSPVKHWTQLLLEHFGVVPLHVPQLTD